LAGDEQHQAMYRVTYKYHIAYQWRQWQLAISPNDVTVCEINSNARLAQRADHLASAYDISISIGNNQSSVVCCKIVRDKRRRARVGTHLQR